MDNSETIVKSYFWRTELSYSYNKNRDEKVRLLGIDTCHITNDIMAIRCVKGT